VGEPFTLNSYRLTISEIYEDQTAENLWITFEIKGGIEPQLLKDRPTTISYRSFFFISSKEARLPEHVNEHPGADPGTAKIVVVAGSEIPTPRISRDRWQHKADTRLHQLHPHPVPNVYRIELIHEQRSGWI